MYGNIKYLIGVSDFLRYWLFTPDSTPKSHSLWYSLPIIVSPKNRFAKPHREPAFQPQGWEGFSDTEWTELTQETFSQVFKKSAVK